MPDSSSNVSAIEDGASVHIQARAPKALRDALELAARRNMTTQSAWMRQAILLKLRADGIEPLKLTG